MYLQVVFSLWVFAKFQRHGQVIPIYVVGRLLIRSPGVNRIGSAMRNRSLRKWELWSVLVSVILQSLRTSSLQEEAKRRCASPPDTKTINAILNIKTEDVNWTAQQESMFTALRRTYKNDFCKLAEVLNLIVQNAPSKTCREVTLDSINTEVLVNGHDAVLILYYMDFSSSSQCACGWSDIFFEFLFFPLLIQEKKGIRKIALFALFFAYIRGLMYL